MQLKTLEQTCNTFDNIKLKLNWEMLHERTGEGIFDFLYVDQGELVGFLGLYSFNKKEVEVSGMVHPSFRRQGIFSQLVQEAIKSCKGRPWREFIFICPGNSASAKAFIEQTGAAYSFSEHYMEREEILSEPGLSPIQVRKASEQDMDILIQLSQDGFDMTYEDAADYLKRRFASNNDLTLIAKLEETPVGQLGLMTKDDESFIFGFCVAPSLRGRGYGRAILKQTIYYAQQVLGTSKVALEVAVDNERALLLYQSCGFEQVSRMDYYVIQLEVSRK